MTCRQLLRGLLLMAACLATASSSQAAGIIFRYLPGRPFISSQVQLSDVEEMAWAPPAESTARGAGGWDWPVSAAARFAAPTSTLQGPDEGSYPQPTGMQLTAEVWMQIEAEREATTLLTNRVGGGEGFTLGLAGGQPYLEVRIGEASWRVTAPQPLAPGAPTWLAATSGYVDGTLQLRLYVNGHEAARAAPPVSISAFYRLQTPVYAGTEAAGDAAAPELTGGFDGYLFGALVRNYVARESYLTSSVPFDGSAYFGLPAFHDYALDASELPMDLRLDESQTPLRYRYFLPYVNDGYIPQGMASHVSVTGGDTTALVYVAYYHRTRDGDYGTRKSIITELDAATGHVRRTFRLSGTLDESHAGGIAYSHGALFVSSSSRLERYPLPAYAGPDGPKYYELEADTEGSIRVRSKASFVSSFRDTLWVGDYRTNSQVDPYLYGYPLDEAGRPVREADPFVVPISRYAQGVEFFERDGTTYLFLSRNLSSSRGEAGIMRYDWAAYQQARGVPDPDTTIIVPHGIEDLSFFPDGTLWTSSESGTDYYSRTAEWPTFYPFVYGLPADAVLPGLATSRSEGALSPAGFGLESYPNPFASTAVVALTLPAAAWLDVAVFDALGRRVDTLFSGVAPAGRQRLSWRAEEHAPGHYFIVAAGADKRVTRHVVLAR